MDALFDHWPVDINDILIESAAKPQQEKESNVRLPAESPTICADLDDLPEDFFADLDLDIVQKRPTESASALPATNTNTNIFEHNLDLESLFELDDEDVFFSSPGTMVSVTAHCHVPCLTVSSEQAVCQAKDCFRD